MAVFLQGVATARRVDNHVVNIFVSKAVNHLPGQGLGLVALPLMGGKGRTAALTAGNHHLTAVGG